MCNRRNNLFNFLSPSFTLCTYPRFYYILICTIAETTSLIFISPSLTPRNIVEAKRCAIFVEETHPLERRRRRMTCLKGSNEGKCRRICIDRREVPRGQRNQITQRPLTWCAACEVWPKTGTPSPGRKGVSLFRGCKLRACPVCVHQCAQHTRYTPTVSFPLLVLSPSSLAYWCYNNCSLADWRQCCNAAMSLG